jgi:TP901 family phage tail tape measure protein
MADQIIQKVQVDVDFSYDLKESQLKSSLNKIEAEINKKMNSVGDKIVDTKGVKLNIDKLINAKHFELLGVSAQNFSKQIESLDKKIAEKTKKIADWGVPQIGASEEKAAAHLKAIDNLQKQIYSHEVQKEKTLEKMKSAGVRRLVLESRLEGLKIQELGLTQSQHNDLHALSKLQNNKRLAEKKLTDLTDERVKAHNKLAVAESKTVEFTEAINTALKFISEGRLDEANEIRKNLPTKTMMNLYATGASNQGILNQVNKERIALATEELRQATRSIDIAKIENERKQARLEKIKAKEVERLSNKGVREQNAVMQREAHYLAAIVEASPFLEDSKKLRNISELTQLPKQITALRASIASSLTLPSQVRSGLLIGADGDTSKSIKGLEESAARAYYKVLTLTGAKTLERAELVRMENALREVIARSGGKLTGVNLTRLDEKMIANYRAKDLEDRMFKRSQILSDNNITGQERVRQLNALDVKGGVGKLGDITTMPNAPYYFKEGKLIRNESILSFGHIGEEIAPKIRQGGMALRAALSDSYVEGLGAKLTKEIIERRKTEIANGGLSTKAKNAALKSLPREAEIEAQSRLGAELSAGTGMLRGAAAVGLVGGTAVAIGAVATAEAIAFTQTVKFDDALHKLAGASKLSNDTLEQMAGTARQVGVNSVFGATETLKAMTELSKLGFKPDQVSKMLIPTENLAAIAGVSTEKSGEAIGAVIHQFGLVGGEASNIADTMANAFTSSGLKFEKLMDTLHYVGPIAHEVGISFKELTAVTALLADQDITASQAGTALRRAELVMNNTSKESFKILKEKKLLNAPLIDQLKELSHHFKDVASVQKEFGVPATAGMSAIFNKFNNELQDMKEGIKTATETFNNIDKNTSGDAIALMARQTDTLAGSWERIKSAMLEMAVSTNDDTGMLGYVKSVAKWAAEALQSLNQVSVMTGMGTTASAARKELEGNESFGGKVNRVIVQDLTSWKTQVAAMIAGTIATGGAGGVMAGLGATYVQRLAKTNYNPIIAQENLSNFKPQDSSIPTRGSLNLNNNEEETARVALAILAQEKGENVAKVVKGHRAAYGNVQSWLDQSEAYKKIVDDSNGTTFTPLYGQSTHAGEQGLANTAARMTSIRNEIDNEKDAVKKATLQKEYNELNKSLAEIATAMLATAKEFGFNKSAGFMGKLKKELANAREVATNYKGIVKGSDPLLTRAQLKYQSYQLSNLFSVKNSPLADHPKNEPEALTDKGGERGGRGRTPTYIRLDNFLAPTYESMKAKADEAREKIATTPVESYDGDAFGGKKKPKGVKSNEMENAKREADDAQIAFNKELADKYITASKSLKSQIEQEAKNAGWNPSKLAKILRVVETSQGDFTKGDATASSMQKSFARIVGELSAGAGVAPSKPIAIGKNKIVSPEAMNKYNEALADYNAKKGVASFITDDVKNKVLGEIRVSGKDAEKELNERKKAIYTNAVMAEISKVAGASGEGASFNKANSPISGGLLGINQFRANSLESINKIDEISAPLKKTTDALGAANNAKTEGERNGADKGKLDLLSEEIAKLEKVREEQEKITKNAVTLEHINSWGKQVEEAKKYGDTIAELGNSAVAWADFQHERRMQQIETEKQAAVEAINHKNKMGLISDRAAQRLIAKENADAEAKKKASFEKDKGLKIAMIRVNAALATMGAIAGAMQLASTPVGMIAATAIGAAEVATIISNEQLAEAQINHQKYATGGFPTGANAMVQVNERGQEAVLNAAATARLGRSAINAINSGANPDLSGMYGANNSRNSSMVIHYSPVISFDASTSPQQARDLLHNDKKAFADKIKDVTRRGYLN